MRLKYALYIAAWAAAILAATPALAQWPERALTMVATAPQNLPWADGPDPQLAILEGLMPKLSQELGVPIKIEARPSGLGILAANMVAGATPDGYVFGALSPDETISWEIQGYTPYAQKELTTIATGWRVVYGIVVPKETKAANLLELAHSGSHPRLAHTGVTPIAISTSMGLDAAKAAGFEWSLEKVDRLDPELLLNGQAEAMILPLNQFYAHPRVKELKILTVLTNAYAPCVGDLPTLESQELPVPLSPLVSFYLPANVNWQIRSRLSRALNSALLQPDMIRRLDESCLIPYIEDLEGAVDAVNREYDLEESRLVAQGFAEAKTK